MEAAMREAMLYKKLDDRWVRCQLCAHYCLIAEGKRGFCNVRENRDGVLYALTYGRTISRGIDPIEKKPFFHFFPGSHSFSIATPGCNMHCEWCQNWQISQQTGPDELAAGAAMSAAEIVAAAEATACRSIAYTYTEPTVFFEYSYETARLAREAGLANLYVSNGYMSAEMLELMTPYLDGANIDLKGFSDARYKRYTGARLQPVLDSLIALHRAGVWLEVTTLVIPGINDDPHELEALAGFIATHLSPEVPWHVSRFLPQYRLRHLPPTPPETIELAVKVGHDAGLHYVYPGNLSGEVVTSCPGCGKALIERRGFALLDNRVTARGCCPECRYSIAGVALGGS
jgi:pyruvate formate lyase activating enzyme